MVDATLQLATSVPIAAGTQDARIALDAPELWETFEGRVLSNGAPVANVDVSLRCRAHDVQARAFGGRVELCFDFPGARTRTDAEGRFKLPDVPKHGCFIVMRGETIIPHSHTLEPTLSARGTDIEVEGRCQLRVDLAPPVDRADAIALVDGEGQPLDILVLSFGSTNATTSLPVDHWTTWESCRRAGGTSVGRRSAARACGAETTSLRQRRHDDGRLATDRQSPSAHPEHPPIAPQPTPSPDAGLHLESPDTSTGRRERFSPPRPPSRRRRRGIQGRYPP